MTECRRLSCVTCGRQSRDFARVLRHEMGKAKCHAAHNGISTVFPLGRDFPLSIITSFFSSQPERVFLPGNRKVGMRNKKYDGSMFDVPGMLGGHAIPIQSFFPTIRAVTSSPIHRPLMFFSSSDRHHHYSRPQKKRLLGTVAKETGWFSKEQLGATKSQADVMLSTNRDAYLRLRKLDWSWHM